MQDPTEHAIEQILAYRGRFQSWGTGLSIVALIAAAWTTAPSLRVEIPLALGAKADINVGYVLALGPALIAGAFLWNLGSLVAMRRYQDALHGSADPPAGAAWISLVGPLARVSPGSFSHWTARALGVASSGIRVVVLFVLPAAAQVAIVNAWVTNLHWFTKETAKRDVEASVSSKTPDANARTSTQKVGALEMFVTGAGTGSRIYTIQNSGFNRRCAQRVVLDELNDRSDLAPAEESQRSRLDTLNPECVALAFPRYELVLNSWVNVISAFVVILLGMPGLALYLSWSPGGLSAGAALRPEAVIVRPPATESRTVKEATPASDALAAQQSVAVDAPQAAVD